MKKIISLLTAILIVSAAALLSAEDFQLVYKDGEVSAKSRTGWSTLMNGDTLSADSQIKLSPGAIAEFSSPNATLLFSKPGIYRLQSAAEQKPQQATTMLSSVFNRIARMGGEDDREQSQAMGVRGSEAGEDAGLTWIDEDSMSFDEAKSAYQNGRYTRAIDILENEVDPIILSDESEYWYYLASAYLATGRKGPALQISQQHSADRFSQVYSDFLLLKGRLQLEAMDYPAAADQLQQYIYSVSSDARKQVGYYLYGIALQRQGQTSNARQALQMAVELNADSELTGLAKEMLK